MVRPSRIFGAILLAEAVFCNENSPSAVIDGLKNLNDLSRAIQEPVKQFQTMNYHREAGAGAEDADPATPIIQGYKRVHTFTSDFNNRLKSVDSLSPGEQASALDGFKQIVATHRALDDMLTAPGGPIASVPFVGGPVASLLKSVADLLNGLADKLVSLSSGGSGSEISRQSKLMDESMRSTINTLQSTSKYRRSYPIPVSAMRMVRRAANQTSGDSTVAAKRHVSGSNSTDTGDTSSISKRTNETSEHVSKMIARQIDLPVNQTEASDAVKNATSSSDSIKPDTQSESPATGVLNTPRRLDLILSRLVHSSLGPKYAKRNDTDSSTKDESNAENKQGALFHRASNDTLAFRSVNSTLWHRAVNSTVSKRSAALEGTNQPLANSSALHARLTNTTSNARLSESGLEARSSNETLHKRGANSTTGDQMI